MYKGPSASATAERVLKSPFSKRQDIFFRDNINFSTQECKYMHRCTVHMCYLPHGFVFYGNNVSIIWDHVGNNE